MGDVIVKPLFGSMGLEWLRVSDEEMAFRVFKTIETIRGVYHLQRAIDHEGRDIRAFVVGDGCWRPSSATRTAGAPTSPAEDGARRPALEAWSALAVRAAAAVGAEYAGVDLLPAATARHTCSRSTGFPAGRGLQATTGSTSAAPIDQLGPGQVNTPDGWPAPASSRACSR
jgi:glutathione synthase/RimK-type ligase-like ATP-grasp enzyme